MRDLAIIFSAISHVDVALERINPLRRQCDGRKKVSNRKSPIKCAQQINWEKEKDRNDLKFATATATTLAIYNGKGTKSVCDKNKNETKTRRCHCSHEHVTFWIPGILGQLQQPEIMMASGTNERWTCTVHLCHMQAVDVIWWWRVSTTTITLIKMVKWCVCVACVAFDEFA